LVLWAPARVGGVIWPRNTDWLLTCAEGAGGGEAARGARIMNRRTTRLRLSAGRRGRRSFSPAAHLQPRTERLRRRPVRGSHENRRQRQQLRRQLACLLRAPL